MLDVVFYMCCMNFIGIFEFNYGLDLLDDQSIAGVLDSSNETKATLRHKNNSCAGPDIYSMMPRSENSCSIISRSF